MLRISKISKVYKTGALIQRALDGVSLSLRDSEFVAILGPSGSGKTTLLNIIGGLDRYDSGDLIINGVSTKKYTDRDWDSYRNHTVGFVFQSYNLIPHQTILENVELALTIGGTTSKDKTARAKAALERVGLGDHIHKKPNQLSGGQMQRVAIARALVNDPDILLADEPTGALDSDTSVQVMELLKEVAKDRLVVMVTHNPELAEQYATRIVTLRDGVIRNDTDPFDDKTDESQAVHKNLGKASMSFFTALRLSFNNLRTKLARTILVSFAGSIGIIGIAMILSMSNGVDMYIQSIEEETLQSYPIQITNTSFDLSGMVASRTDAGDDEPEKPKTEKAVRERHTITTMLSGVTTNDLESLKAFFESEGRDINAYVRAIEYNYGVTPQIYTLRDGKVRQVNPDKSFAALGFSTGGYGSSLMSSLTSTDTFHLMPEDESLYKTAYDVKAGRWPEKYNECVLVLSGTSRVTDMALYTMGLKNPARLDEMLRLAVEGGTPETDIGELQFDYADFLGISFKLIAASDRFSYDDEYGVWTDRSDDETFMRSLLEGAEDISIVGVVVPREDASNLALSSGIGYPASLVYHIIDLADSSASVKAQLDNKETDIFTGKRFDDYSTGADFDMASLFSIDEQALADAFTFDPEQFEIDPSDFDMSDMELGPGDFDFDMPSISGDDLSSLLGSVKLDLSAEKLSGIFEKLIKSYTDSAGEDGVTELSELPTAIRAYLGTEEARGIISADAQAAIASAQEKLVTIDDLRESLERIMAGLEDYLAENPVDSAERLRTVAEYLAQEEISELIRAEADRLSEKAASALDLTGLATDLTTHLVEGYEAYAAENDEAPTITDVTNDLRAYLEGEEAQRIITEGVAGIIDTSGIETEINKLVGKFSGSISSQISSLMTRLVGKITEKFSDIIGDMFADFSIDPEAISSAFSTNFSVEELKSLMTSMMSTERSSLDSNLRKLGYADLNKPSSITIYPTDFDGKSAVKGILTGYNDMRKAQSEDDKVISYTDYVDTLMSGVTDIIDAVSYVLVAFVSISLVVSSIMIGVITYISVLERKKEIGILRAIGASKRNISEVFNAETFIIGALAGIFGVVITWILIIPTNIIIHNATGQNNINAVLPVPAALILVALSIVLTLIGGIIPSQKAARSDPVTALRSE